MSSTKLDHVLIIGGGITGLASALALNALNVRCTVYELRATPSTIGGAVNLTPSALRCLEHLGVLPHIQGKGCDTRSIEVFSTLTGHQLGELSFRNVDKFKYHARRISRAALLRGLLDTLEGTDVKIEYGKKLVALTETDVSVEATFDDGTSAKGDILLGCDGIHSNTRMKLVDPTRLPVYTGISTAYGTVPVSSIPSPLHFQDGALNSSRQGSLLTAFCDAKKETIYAAAVMEVKEQLNHEGWKVKGSDQDATRKELLSRFGDSKMPCLVEIVEKVEDLYFYPVNTLPSGGKWSSKRAILLGDAAHAMPPMGESIGLALEDAALFARIVECHPDKPVLEIFSMYEGLRRKTIESAIREAEARWDGIKDKGWLVRKLIEWMTPWFLWWTQESRETAWASDIRDLVPST